MVNSSRSRSVLIFLSLLLLQLLNGSCARDGQSPQLAERNAPYAAGRILIKFHGDPSALLQSAAAKKLDVRFSHEACGAVQIYSVRPGSELEAVATFRLNPAVEFAEPDYLIFAAHTVRNALPVGGPARNRAQTAGEQPLFSPPLGTAAEPPNDPLFDQQWALPKINAPMAWKFSSGSGVTIAVIDSGVDLDHPELAGRIVGGHDFVNNDEIPEDDYGHGTQVAGVAAAATNNNFGIAGLAWSAGIMPVKVLDESGRGVSSNLTCAIYWAVDHGAHIMNISIISYGPSNGMQTALDYAATNGVVVFAAAGNLFEEGNPVTYPASHNGVIAVAATDRNDAHAWFSSAGDFVDIAAPGVSIFSPFPPDHGEYRAMYGTSLSTPHGAGLAALILSAAPGLAAGDVESIMRDSAVDLGEPGRDGKFGYGRIDAAAAMSLTLSSLPWRVYLPALNSPLPTPTAIPTAIPTPTLTPTPAPSQVSDRQGQ